MNIHRARTLPNLLSVFHTMHIHQRQRIKMLCIASVRAHFIGWCLVFVFVFRFMFADLMCVHELPRNGGGKTRPNCLWAKIGVNSASQRMKSIHRENNYRKTMTRKCNSNMTISETRIIIPCSQNQWLFTKHLIKQMTLTSLLCPFLSARLAYKIHKHLHHFCVPVPMTKYT